jgi:hypothetical protein
MSMTQQLLQLRCWRLSQVNQLRRVIGAARQIPGHGLKYSTASTPTGETDDKEPSSKTPTPHDPPAVAPQGHNVEDFGREINGPKGPEPTRYGDWERKGRVSDF